MVNAPRLDPGRYKEAPSSVDFYTEHLPEDILTIDAVGRNANKTERKIQNAKENT